MTDQELAEALKMLGMDPSSWRALPLLPLVQVAWADGQVQEAERELILDLARTRWHLEEEGQRLLKNWLHHAPSLGYVRRGQRVLLALCSRPKAAGSPSGWPAPTRDQLADVVVFAQEVARAAGGFFGHGAIAAEEAAAIDEIAAALDIRHDRSWATPDDATVIPSDADQNLEGPPVEIQFHPHRTGRSRGTLVHYDELTGEQVVGVDELGVTVGRNRDNDVTINWDSQVSRRHCRFFSRDGKFYVEDLQSTIGTWVNGERILERRLLGGESVHVGASAFFFQLSPEDPPTEG